MLQSLATLVATAFVQQLVLHEVGVSEPAPGSCTANRTLHLIRHAEGWHNVDELTAERDGLHKTHPQGGLRAEFGIAWMLLERVSGRKYHDPLLTPKGREQAYRLRASLRDDGNFSVDVVALSPMRRTIETALLGLPQLEAATTSFALEDPPPVLPALVATDELRERVAHFMPDSRLKRTELEREYGRLGGGASIDFSAVPDDDVMFAEGRELGEPEVGSPLLAKRAAGALRWLGALPQSQRNIAVVSHKHFLGALTGLYPDTVAQRPFENAERRTVLMCLQGGDEPTDDTDTGAGGDGDDGLTVKPVRARVTPVGGVARGDGPDLAASIRAGQELERIIPH